jgi:hypothetical protein
VQLPPQTLPAHVYGAQVWSCSAGQLPAPSHEAASTATPELHEGLRHVVLLSGYVHEAVVVPLHVPPQRLPSVAHAVRGTRGVPETAVQVPTLPDSAHASH